MAPFRTDSSLAELIELAPSHRIRQSMAKALYSLRDFEYFWDPWLLKDDDCYRLFYLKAPKPSPTFPFWSQGTVYGAISKDFKTWESTGIALAPDPDNWWESGRICAGNAYKENGIYYLFYSASGGGELLKEERIGLATSIDGIHWNRASTQHFFSETEWSQWYGHQADTQHFHWRDPYILHQSGKYYMFISAHQKHNTASKYHGCVGLAVADKISGPYRLLPPVAGPEVSAMDPWPFTEVERPQVIYHHGRYHLFFSCWPWNLNPAWLDKIGSRRVRESSLYWLVSDTITGPYRPVSDFPIVKGSTNSGLYATNLFTVDSEAEGMIAFGWYHRIYTLQVSSSLKVNFSPQAVEIINTRKTRSQPGISTKPRKVLPHASSL